MVSSTAGAQPHVGTYTISASGAASSDYSISYVPAVYTVNPAALTITALAASATYGSGNPTFGVSYAGFQYSDTSASLTTGPTVSSTAGAQPHVGTYTVSASGAASDDYSISYVPAVYTVNPAALTVTALSASATYGNGNPAFGVSYGGFQYSDTSGSLTTPPTVGSTAGAQPHMGTYTITPSGAASSDYSISYVPAVYTVNPAALTITALAASATYGSGNPTFGVSYAGFQYMDTAASLSTPPTVSSTAGAQPHVGTYTISASGAASSDYSISYVPAVYTVNPAALTITALAASATYGSGNPTFGVSYSGFQVHRHGSQSHHRPNGQRDGRRPAACRDLHHQRERGGEQRLQHQLRARRLHREPGGAHDHGPGGQRHLRQREPDVRGQLQRFPVHRHGSQSHHRPNGQLDGRRPAACRDLHHQRERGGEQRLQHQLRARRLHREPGGAHDHRSCGQRHLRQREPNVRCQLQRFPV